MARPYWKGAISFGLVNVPVSLTPSTKRLDFAFHLYHDADGGRIREKRVCERDGKEVPWQHIVKGYELSKTQVVTLTQEELRAADPERDRTIGIEEFVKVEEVDPVQIDGSYYVAPDARSGKAYALLSAALERTGQVAIARIVLAGGMSVVPALKRGRFASVTIVNIKGIREATVPALDATGQSLVIGALVRHREIETSRPVAEHFPELATLEQTLASVQIRNHGTLVGNLCAAEPWSDPPCLLAALDATLVVVNARGERRAAAADWISGAGETLRQPDELVLRIALALPHGRAGASHHRVAARHGLARPLACAAARVTLGRDGAVATARVFVGAVGPRPQRMRAAEATIEGRRMDRSLAAEIEAAVVRAVE
ncbi:MAG TPA: Ku protein, partial [Myxococcaceae bacterium]